MPTGCRRPSAANFDPAATKEDYSCVYMLKNQDNCHWFEDVVPDQENDRSFTMSYSIEGGGWAFFHDYQADMYLHTRTQLYSIKDSEIFKHHAGRPGKYYTTTVHPFFIDVVFQSKEELILETVNWMSEFITSNTDQPFKTLTHITIWNSYQHSTRIELAKLQSFKDYTVRSVQGDWSFNDFRNLLVAKGVQFLQSLFNDYAVVDAQVDEDMAWYKRELLTDKWFCVRFEFDNVEQATVYLNDTTITAQKSDR